MDTARAERKERKAHEQNEVVITQAATSDDVSAAACGNRHSGKSQNGNLNEPGRQIIEGCDDVHLRPRFVFSNLLISSRCSCRISLLSCKVDEQRLCRAIEDRA
jgi:hypothetical protein